MPKAYTATSNFVKSTQARLAPVCLRQLQGCLACNNFAVCPDPTPLLGPDAARMTVMVILRCRQYLKLSNIGPLAKGAEMSEVNSRAVHLNVSFARAAGTSRGCLGVPFRWLKQDCRYAIGFRGKESWTELSTNSLPLLNFSRSFFCRETESIQVG